ncbi:MAG: MFS transporter [SAR202 cluster bacterium]|nr:MFS transporter [SAR202 cluster bacterium]
MVILDVSVVNVALPSIQNALNFSTEGLQWVVTGYALTFGGFLLLGGRVGDILGRRKMFMVGLALFVACSLLCGLAWNSTVLVVPRLLQGAASAILSPSVFSIVSVTFREGSERNKALGVLGAIAGSGAAIGVILGGVLTEYVGWEWIFFLNVPIGILAFALVPMVVRESRASQLSRDFDAQGATAITASLLLFVYALTRAPEVGWGAGQTIGMILGSVALLGLFVAIEIRSKSPLVPMRVFKRRTLTGANVLGLILGTSIFGMFFLLSLYMQQVLGFSALKTGVGYLGIALTIIVTAGISQALVTKLGVKPVLMTGLALLSVGLIYFTQISPDGSYFVDLFPGFILTGIGMGFSFIPISIAALSGVEDKQAGLASGLINMSQQIGGALGLAILITVATSRANGLIGAGTPPPVAFTDGFSLAFWVSLGFAVTGFVAAGLVLKGKDLKAVSAAAPI